MAYDVYVKYNGYNQKQYDGLIQKLSPNNHVGAGYNFFNDKRDNHFVVNTYKQALNLASRARKLRKVRGLSKLTACIYKEVFYS
jgi:hypothetical protein